MFSQWGEDQKSSKAYWMVTATKQEASKMMALVTKAFPVFSPTDMTFISTKIWQGTPVDRKNGLLDMQYYYGITHEAINFQGIRNPSLQIAEYPDVWHANQSPPTITIVDWLKTWKTLDGQSLFTEVMVSTKGDIDLWYEEANHEEARVWLKTFLSTIVCCSGINPNTDLPKIEEMFTEPAQIVQYLEDKYSPLIIQK
jgi:hypothetical protein